MIDDILGGLLGGREEARDLVLFRRVQLVGSRDIDQLVINRHAFFLDEEAFAGHAFDGHLVQFDIAVSAHNRIDLLRHQRRREREIHIDQFDIREFDTVLAENGAEQSFLGSGDRIADLLALEIGDGIHRSVVAGHQAVER